jgi:hypothetical protein
MKSNPPGFSKHMRYTSIKPDPIKGLGSGFRSRRCVLLLLQTSRAKSAPFPCWVGCTMTINEQHKPWRLYFPRVSKRDLTYCDDRLKIPAYIGLPFPVFLPWDRRKRHLSAWLPRYLPVYSLSGVLLILDFSERMCQVASTAQD